MNAAKQFLKLSLQSNVLYKQVSRTALFLFCSINNENTALIEKPMLPKRQTLMNGQSSTGRDMVLCETEMLLI